MWKYCRPMKLNLLKGLLINIHQSFQSINTWVEVISVHTKTLRHDLKERWHSCPESINRNLLIRVVILKHSNNRFYGFYILVMTIIHIMEWVWLLWVFIRISEINRYDYWYLRPCVDVIKEGILRFLFCKLDEELSHLETTWLDLELSALSPQKIFYWCLDHANYFFSHFFLVVFVFFNKQKLDLNKWLLPINELKGITFELRPHKWTLKVIHDLTFMNYFKGIAFLILLLLFIGIQSIEILSLFRKVITNKFEYKLTGCLFLLRTFNY